jgi:hypothetical protein
MTETAGAPTHVTRRWVRLVVGFGVGVTVGLAPYLGAVDVPLFRPLLSLYPVTLQGRLIPLSAFVMGVMAVVIQWHGGERLSARWLRRAFRGWTYGAVVSLLALMILRAGFVVDIPLDGGRQNAAFVVGWSRLEGCPCAQQDDAVCISETLTLNPTQLGRCWNARSLRGEEFLLQLTYLVLLSCFGTLVGLVVLREAAEGRGSRRPADIVERRSARR